MTDEEEAVIHAAREIDALLWPTSETAGVPLAKVHQVVQQLHDAVTRLAKARAQEQS
jgi:hypothetical protein